MWSTPSNHSYHRKRRAILRLGFSVSDRARMNRLAAKNRQGKLKPEEAVEFEDLISLAILAQSAVEKAVDHPS